MTVQVPDDVGSGVQGRRGWAGPAQHPGGAVPPVLPHPAGCLAAGPPPPGPCPPVHAAALEAAAQSLVVRLQPDQAAPQGGRRRLRHDGATELYAPREDISLSGLHL